MEKTSAQKIGKGGACIPPHMRAPRFGLKFACVSAKAGKPFSVSAKKLRLDASGRIVVLRARQPARLQASHNGRGKTTVEFLAI